MAHDFLDRYSRLHSPIHALGAGWKAGGAMFLVLLVVLTPPSRALWLAAPAAALLLIAVLSRIPWRFLAGRLLLLEPLAIGVALLALFQEDGWRLFLLLVAKSTLCLLAMVLLSNTTPFSRLLDVLRALRVPGLLITTLALMYRYIFVLIDESHRLRRARSSRTFVRGRRGAWKGLATVIGQLFVRSTERAERVYAAMCARGWR
jgi:cobalt/nickel transport system permease protein